MPIAPRFWVQNHTFNGAALTPSSEAAGNPVDALADQQRNYFWRTATGWTITEHNRYIDFNRGGVKVATVALGTYTTGAALCTAIVAALEAADATPVWTSDYNVAATDKFNINAGTTYSLLWSTGTNAYRSIGRSLGFTTSSDDTGATNYTSDNVSYQSSHHLVIALTAAEVATGTTAAAVIAHNVSLIAVSFRIESSATNVWSTPTVQGTFSGLTVNDCRKYFSDPAHAFYRLVVEDVSNPTGYFQLGVLFLGPYTASPYCTSDNRTDGYEDFSSLNMAINGANFSNLRDKRYTFQFEISDIEEFGSVFHNFRQNTFDLMNVGQNIIIDLDPTGIVPVPWGLLYGYCPELPVMPHTPGNYWSFNFPFVKAL